MEHGELIFGTDGVRDRAGSGFLLPRAVRRLALAAARVLEAPERFPVDFPWSASPGRAPARRTILIGRDTRESGPALVGCIGDAFRAAGFPVVDLGVIPTPGVARLAAAEPSALLGIVVSASHNPAEYNGIKFVSPTGAKATEELEKAVSDAYWRSEGGREGAPAPVREDPDAIDRYVGALRALVRDPAKLRGARIVLDAANGATFEAAPRLFRALGADARLIAASPDGRNINRDCGTLHPQALARAVVEQGADLGFAFDGDGDRMIPVTREGEVLDGDHILAVAGIRHRRAGRLPEGTVVATVMSNIGLEKALGREGIALLRTPVGDRNVYDAMVRGSHPIGGEQSGHIIFLDDARTGDGLLAALRLLDAIDGLDLSDAARVMVRYPQVLLNFPVPRKVPFEDLPEVGRALESAEGALEGDGRILLRYSGTEPVARVMIEGPDETLIGRLAGGIGAAIVSSIR